jgi:hypothetical protein
LHYHTTISPRDYGLVWPGTVQFVAMLFLAMLTLFVANALGFYLVGPILFGQEHRAFDYFQVFPDSPQLALVAVYYLSATACVCESLFEIALPWLWFSQGESVSRRGKVAFALVCALIFGLTHWESGWHTVAGAFTYQVAAVAWYLAVRTLWPIIGAHFLIDLYWFSLNLMQD